MPHKSKGLYCRYDRDKIAAAVAACRAGMSVRKASGHFGIPRSTLCDRLTGKIADDAAPGKPPVIPREAEAKIAESVFEAADKGFGMSRLTVMKKAGDVCKKVGIRTPFRHGIPGKDWWQGFKKRNNQVALRKPEKLTGGALKGNKPSRCRLLFYRTAQHYFERSCPI